jgi:hypothetical protein
VHETQLKGIVAQAPLERGALARRELIALSKYPLVKGVRRNLQCETDVGFCLYPESIAAFVNLQDLILPSIYALGLTSCRQ